MDNDSVNENRIGRKPRVRLALLGLATVLVMIVLLSNVNKTIIGTSPHSAIENPTTGNGEWSGACERKLRKIGKNPVECAKFPVAKLGRLHRFGEEDDSRSLEQALSWSAVRSAAPDFDCSSPHKIGRMTQRNELLLVYHDNTVATIKNDECHVAEVFIPKDGKVNPKAKAMVNGAKRVLADKGGGGGCRGLGTSCSRDGECCGHGVAHDSPGCCWGRCKKRRVWSCTCQGEGHKCVIGSDCCGWNFNRIGSKQCCGGGLFGTCQHLHNYNGRKRCGPKRTVFIRSLHHGKVMDVAGWGKHNGASIHMWSFHGGNNQKFEVYFTNAWSRVRCVDSGKYWSYDNSGNLIQTDWKWNDCKQRFKFVKHGAFYKIHNKCHNKCLDFSHSHNGARVKIWGCNGNRSQLWRI